MNNLYQILENTVQAHSDQTALTFEHTRISYALLKESVDRLACGLKKLGLGPNDRVALLLPNVPHFVISYFALLKIGVSVVPLSFLLKHDGLSRQLMDAQVRGIIFWEGFRSTVRQAVSSLSGIDFHLVLTDKAETGEIRLQHLMEVNDPLRETALTAPDDTALIIYTAGTTGCVKGTELTHLNILSNTKACCQYLKLTPDDCAIGVIPMYHPLGQTLVMNTFFQAGARIILLPRFNAAELIEMIASEKPTVFIGVPNMYRALLDQPTLIDADLSSLRYCLSSGDAMPPDILTAFEKACGLPILEGYELTEASPVVSFNKLVRERRAGSIGFPLPGIEMKIVDESGNEVKYGEVGEIIVQGPNVMKGYWNQPAETQKALRDGWLFTGDMAMLKEDGFGYIVVRKQHVIIKGGFHVYPNEIEKILLEHHAIQEAVVVGVPDPIHGEEIHASVVVKDGERVDQEELMTFCDGLMITYKCPKRIHFVVSLPKGPTGKVDRDEVRQTIVAHKPK